MSEAVLAGQGGPGGQAGPGGLLDARVPGAALVPALRQNSQDYTWAAATVGANNAAGLQLASGEAILAVGGFNGTDPAPTLDQFQSLVRAGAIHYFVASSQGAGATPSGPGGGTSTTSGSEAASEITAWVTRTFTATTVEGSTAYDLTAATSTGG